MLGYTEWRNSIVPMVKSHHNTDSPLLSVVTLTIPGREDKLKELEQEIAAQSQGEPVEHLVHSGPNHYGTEMRRSLEESLGRYVAYVDDDDFIEKDYIKRILSAIRTDVPDVVTFGSYTPGFQPAWLRANREDNSGRPEEGNVKTANHYCAWRRDIALSSPWLPRNYGAEYLWYTMIHLAYPTLKESHIHECLHIYRYDESDTKCQNREAIRDSMSAGGGTIFLYRHRDGRLLAGKNLGKLQDAAGNPTLVTESDLTLLRKVVFG